MEEREEQLHSAGNKLTYKHIYFKNQVMKVNKVWEKVLNMAEKF